MLTSDQKIKINEKVQGFKEAADFYRMEYSQDLMGMFRDFGCMLLEACGINAEGDPEIKQLFGYRQVLRGTVKRQLTVIAEELAGLWKAPVSGEMFQTALSGMFNFCLYSKGGKNRYLLPVEIAEPLLGLVTCPEGMLSPGEGETVLDTQCGAGSTLMTACKYLKNPKLMGYELDEELWAAGIIISRLSDLKMELHLQEEIPACLYETCNLVISNPVYGTDTIKDDSLAEELPSELRTVRGRYHMELIRGMLALKYDGRAMLIVPNSFLFATRTESIKVRKWLLQSYSLEAVIALPEDTFLYSGVRSSVMIFSKPFMSSGWEGHTQRDSYYGKWERCRREKTVENRNDIKVPANWQYNSFWFAGAAGIEAAKWNLLPENYRPEEQINLEIEDPALLLQEMLREQEEITRELKELLKEVG